MGGNSMHKNVEIKSKLKLFPYLRSKSFAKNLQDSSKYMSVWIVGDRIALVQCVKEP